PYVLKLADPLGYTTLAEIIGDICERCSLTSTQYDVSELTEDQVLGYALTRESTGRGGIDPLRSTGLFDVVESGQKLAFQKRARASSATLEDDDLGAYLEGSTRVPAVST